MVPLRSCSKTILTVLFFFFSSVSHSQNSDGARKRLEDLFIWKVCDELALPLEQERKLTETLKNINHKRFELQQSLSQQAEALKKNNKLLAEYRKTLEKLNKVQLDEIDDVSKIIGKEKAAQYVYLKTEISNRIRNHLQGEAKDDKVPISRPKIIEEK